MRGPCPPQALISTPGRCVAVGRRFMRGLHQTRAQADAWPSSTPAAQAHRHKREQTLPGHHLHPVYTGARLKHTPTQPPHLAHTRLRVQGEHLFFVTSKRSAKVEEIRRDPATCLAFSNDAAGTWATLSANAEVTCARAAAVA